MDAIAQHVQAGFARPSSAAFSMVSMTSLSSSLTWGRTLGGYISDWTVNNGVMAGLRGGAIFSWHVNFVRLKETAT